MVEIVKTGNCQEIRIAAEALPCQRCSSTSQAVVISHIHDEATAGFVLVKPTQNPIPRSNISKHAGGDEIAVIGC